MTRKLGSLEGPALGLGCMGMGGMYGTPTDRPAMLELFRGAYGRGVIEGSIGRSRPGDC